MLLWGRHQHMLEEIPVVIAFLPPHPSPVASAREIVIGCNVWAWEETYLCGKLVMVRAILTGTLEHTFESTQRMRSMELHVAPDS